MLTTTATIKNATECTATPVKDVPSYGIIQNTTRHEILEPCVRPFAMAWHGVMCAVLHTYGLQIEMLLERRREYNRLGPRVFLFLPVAGRRGDTPGLRQSKLRWWCRKSPGQHG